MLLQEALDLIELTIQNVPKNKAIFLEDVNVRDATALRLQAPLSIGSWPTRARVV